MMKSGLKFSVKSSFTKSISTHWNLSIWTSFQ